jgi:hypothetical protein
MKSSFRCLSSFVIGAAFITFALLSPNCQPSGGDLNTDEGSGGNESGGSSGNGTGGSGSGGSQASGTGGSGSGGSQAGGSGGSGSGGATGNGGRTGSGGGNGSGGKTGNGGATGNGGVTGSGGKTGNGGATGNGGTTTTTVNPGSGGTTSTSTSTSTTPGGTTVVFGAGKGQGAMTGYGFVALGASDTLSSPTCGASKTPITKAAPCAADPNWSSTSALCITGSIPALPASPTSADYTNNWGVSVGVNATDPEGGGLGQSFTSVTITVTGSPTTGLRALVHKKGEAVDTSYCAPLTSGTAIPFTSFVTDCYNTVPAGTKITATDVPNIDKITVQVSSGSAAITVTDLCITGITFAK